MFKSLKKIIKIIRVKIIYFLIILFKFFFRKEIYFGRLNSKSKISGLVSYIEPILRKLNNKENFIIIIDPGNKKQNSFLWNKYNEKIILIGHKNYIKRFILNLLFFLFFKDTKFDLKLKDFLEIEYQYLFNDFNPIVQFNDKEVEIGDKVLTELNLKKENYICFGLREALYYQKFKHKNIDAQENTFHRNPNPKNYIKTIDLFCKQNISFVRCGLTGETNFKKQKNFYDYANSTYRSDFLDFYLQKNSKFVLAGACGLHLISAALNKPSVETDTYTLWGGRQKFDLFIPRLLKNNKTNKIFSFKEMMDVGQKYLFEENCQKDHVSFIENTEQDILEVCLEMNARLDKTWIEKQEDIDRQSKFKSLFPPKPSSYFKPEDFFYKKNVIPAGNIGCSFLKKYEYLFD